MKPAQLRACDLCGSALDLLSLTFWRITLQHFGFVTQDKPDDDAALLLDETLELLVCETCSCRHEHPINILGEMAHRRLAERKAKAGGSNGGNHDSN